MTVWQVKRQLAFLASQLAFVESPQGLVFTGGAYVSEDLEGNWLPLPFLPDGPATIDLDEAGGLEPFCRVSCDHYELSRTSLGRVKAMTLKLGGTAGGGFDTQETGAPTNTSAEAFDTHGVNQVTGALRGASSAYGSNPSGQGLAQGRDADELVDRFLEAYAQTGFVDSVHGFQGFARSGERLERYYGSQVLKRTVDVEVTNGTCSLYYHNPVSVTATAISGHAIQLAWGAAPQRYDSIGYAVYRGSNPGDPAPAYGAGHLVGVVAYGTNTITDAGPSGSGQTFNYSVFAIYAETPAGFAAKTVERVSSGVQVAATTT
jgi:hypothetical protein